MLFKNLLTHRQSLHTNAQLLLGILCQELPAASVLYFFLKAARFHSKNPRALSLRDGVGLASLPELPLHCCLLANI